MAAESVIRMSSSSSTASSLCSFRRSRAPVSRTIPSQRRRCSAGRVQPLASASFSEFFGSVRLSSSATASQNLTLGKHSRKNGFSVFAMAADGIYSPFSVMHACNCKDCIFFLSGSCLFGVLLHKVEDLKFMCNWHENTWIFIFKWIFGMGLGYIKRNEDYFFPFLVLLSGFCYWMKHNSW